MDQRESGILLPVSALPGPYGVGTLGAPALNFIDFLARAGQSNWQILPLVPPGGGNSPYMSPSSFAGNPLLLDLEELAAEGLLTREELEGAKKVLRAAAMTYVAATFTAFLSLLRLLLIFGGRRNDN